MWQEITNIVNLENGILTGYWRLKTRKLHKWSTLFDNLVITGVLFSNSLITLCEQGWTNDIL